MFSLLKSVVSPSNATNYKYKHNHASISEQLCYCGYTGVPQIAFLHYWSIDLKPHAQIDPKHVQLCILLPINFFRKRIWRMSSDRWFLQRESTRVWCPSTTRYLHIWDECSPAVTTIIIRHFVAHSLWVWACTLFFFTHKTSVICSVAVFFWLADWTRRYPCTSVSVFFSCSYL